MNGIRIFGVKNDELISKLLEILDFHEVEYEFLDFRDNPPSDELLYKWGDFEGVELPTNQRNSLFKRNKKKFNLLDNPKKTDWIRQNYHVIIRPIIENKNGEVLSIGGRPERVARTVFGISLPK